MPVTNEEAGPWMPYEPALPNGSPTHQMGVEKGVVWGAPWKGRMEGGENV